MSELTPIIELLAFLFGKVEFEGWDLARGNGVVWLSGAFSVGKVTHVKLDLAREGLLGIRRANQDRMPRTILKPDSQAELEGGLLEGDRADADGGPEVVLTEYDTCVCAYSFGGIVLHCRPLAGGVLPECLGGSVAGTRIEADRSCDLE